MLDGVDVVPEGVEVVPGCVDVVPCGVEVVPGTVDVVGVVCPMPGLGVTVPVVCAVAIPSESANTDEANKIFFINLLLLLMSAALRSDLGKILRSKIQLSNEMQCRQQGDAAGRVAECTIPATNDLDFFAAAAAMDKCSRCFYPSACPMQ